MDRITSSIQPRAFPQELTDDELFKALPLSFLVFRIYSQDHQHDAALHAALSSVLGAATDAAHKHVKMSRFRAALCRQL